MNDETVRIINRVISCYSLSLIVIGTVSNVFSFLVCIREKLIKLPTFVFYSFMFASNTVGLYIINIHYCIFEIYGVEILDSSIAFCNIGHFIYFVAVQTSPWFLVCVNLINLLISK